MRVLAVAVLAVALVGLALDAAGMHLNGATGLAVGPARRVQAVQPGSPAARAGIRAGDSVRFDHMALVERVALARSIPGRAAAVVIQRGDVIRTVVLIPAAQPYWTPYIGVYWLLTLVYAAMAVLVAWRAQRGRQRSVIVVILTSLSLAASLEAISGVIPAMEVRLLGRVAADVFIAIFLIAAFLFVLWYPPRRTRALIWLWRLGLPISVCAALVFAIPNEMGLTFDVSILGDVLTLLASAAMIAGVIDGVLGGDAEYRTPAIIAGSTLIALALVNVFLSINDIEGTGRPWNYYLALLQWSSGFGVTYAVLRHRLLDLDLVISRAAIFSTVSLALLALFALLEWVFATILEHTLGSGFGGNGKAALAAATALLVGLSAGTIHRAIEHRLNRVFFAKRYRALSELHRFALETDAATDANALLELTLNTLRRNLDAAYVALYTGTPVTGYVAAGTTMADLPLHFDQNEELVLRLRRWSQAFIVDYPGHRLMYAYLAPMVLRGTLYGFAICGPKSDRTAYLPDEQETIAALVHRVGIAWEWLTRGNTAMVRERS